MISVIIPALNEEKALPATLRSVLRQPGHYEVIVVDGGSEDGTVEIVHRHPCVRLLTAPKGRASQMNAGARVAGGEWLLFLHADTLLPSDSVQRLNKLESDLTVQAGGFRHRFSGEDWRLQCISWMDNLRCGYSRTIYGDQAFFIRRALFEHIDGFPEQGVLEDVRICQKLSHVTRPVLLDDYVVTDSRKFIQAGVWRSLARVAIILTCHRLGLPLRGRAFFANVR